MVDAGDRDHKWAVAQWAEIEPPLLTCEAVIAEACFLLDQTRAGSAAVFEMLVRRAVAVSVRLDEHLREVQALRAKYADVPMPVADASLVRMAEQLSRSAVLTLDRDFTRYRKHARHIIPLIMPEARRRQARSSISCRSGIR